MPQRPRGTAPTVDEAPPEEPQNVDGGEQSDEEDERSPFCLTDIDNIPGEEFALYKRVSTVLHKAGITSPEQLQGMKYSQRRRIRGLGANGLELIEETLATGEEDRISLLFQEPGRRTTSRKYGPSPFIGVPAHIADRLKKNGIASSEQLRGMSDDELREIKGLGRSAIDKIRASFPPPALSEAELASIEARPGKVKASTVKALVAEVRAARNQAGSVTNGAVEANGNGAYDEDTEGETEGELVGAAAE